jgi:3-methyladenine DNA glycosylase/8-oxoguanine DNA glycosylase
VPPFDLARTAAPVWWARGRWPNVDWHDRSLIWIGLEEGRIVDRTVRQLDPATLLVSGSASAAADADWVMRVLGTAAIPPTFTDPLLVALAASHPGFRPWANGSLFEGAISSIVGQSISVAAAATTECRLYAMFNPGREIAGRTFWPAPGPDQLAAADPEKVRGSGVTTKRAEALVEAARAFANGEIRNLKAGESGAETETRKLLSISGIGPWTVRSAQLWGLAEADAHPTGDVALLRCTRRHYPNLGGLKELDALSERWRPARGWAARLIWLDGLGWDGGP